jgi:hypothetical protein
MTSQGPTCGGGVTESGSPPQRGRGRGSNPNSPFDTPPSGCASPPAPSSPSSNTRQRLREARESGGISRLSKRKRSELHEAMEEVLAEQIIPGEGGRDDEQTKLRRLDRCIRWSTFLFHTTDIWDDILQSVYGPGFDLDSSQIITARQKIFDNVKQYKHKMLARLKVRSASLFDVLRLLTDLLLGEYRNSS